jgi:hypothetical protein
MISRQFLLSRRLLFAAAALAVIAAGVLVLTLSNKSQAGDVQSRIGHHFNVLDTSGSSGVQVVDPSVKHSAAARAKVKNATPSNPVVFTGGPVDTRRIRRSSAPRTTRGVNDSSVRGTWVAPSSNGGVCFLLTVGQNEGAGGTCSQSGSILDGATMLLIGHGTNGVSEGETVLAGAVPDDVTGVKVDLVDGTTTTIGVVDNAFTFDTSVAVADYSYVTDEGTTDPKTVEGPNA